MLKVRDFLATAEAALADIYSATEAEALAVRLCEEILGVKSYQWVLDPSMEVPPATESRLSSSLRRLCEGEPLQYVLGYTYFCSSKFNVNPSVLIPRPETEELCILVAKECGGWPRISPDDTPIQNAGFSARDFNGLRIMDLGTGSGCIAWSLALLLPGSEVFGVDVSEEALSVARTQPLVDKVARYGAKVPQFVQADILSDTFFDSASEKSAYINKDSSSSEDISFPEGDFDIIVSNPPYIRLSERDALPENVKNHEPDLALFVPDDDPMIFFRAIANFSVKRLRNGGFGFVEINEALGEPTAAIFSSAGFSSVKILRDFRAKIRFIAFQK